MKYLTNVKSYYSLRQSTLSIDKIIEQAKAENKSGFVLCDKNMLGVKEAYDKCQKENLKLIIGLELNVNFGNAGKLPISLIAKNNQGYKELIKLSTNNELSPFSIDYQDIFKQDNLIKIIDSDSVIGARNKAGNEYSFLREISSIFNNPNISSLYLGKTEKTDATQLNYLNSRIFNNKLKILEFNPKRASTVQEIDALQTISNFQKEFNSFRYDELLSSIDNTYEMNTDIVFDECNVEINKENILPRYESFTEEEAYNKLVEHVKKGLIKNYTVEELKSKVPIQRTNMELNVIKKMGFSNYFLIVMDYVNWAKEQGIEVGPGRGSAAGSIVAYATGITEIDPLKYGLIFERFLNPERVTMPDIDVDFESARRQEVVDYIINKYGGEYAAQIVTFTNYGFKVAANDLAKAYGLNVAQANEIKKVLPETSKTPDDFSCQEFYKSSIEFKSVVDKYNFKDKLAQIDALARMPRGLGTHAGGVVISGTPLSNVVPLIMSGGNVKTVQYSKKYIESVGLLKMDILAVDNLSKNKEILDLIKENNDSNSLDLSKIDLNDKKVFDLINTRDTAGIFQLDTPVAKETIRQMKCNSFNDLVAVISLGRPGPMDNLPEFCARKNGEKPITYDVPELEPILKDTYGIIVFQEQVMQCATDLAGMSMAKADEMRRAMSSKKLSILEDMKVEFVEGCEKNGISKENAEKVYKTMEKFAEYGFNKSHAVCYAKIAYKLAYLKTYYPKEFYCSLLNHSSKKEDILNRCKTRGITILPPSINEAKLTSLIKGEAIMLPITEIKGVGEAAAKAILSEREKNGSFDNIVEFVERMTPGENDVDKGGKKLRNQLTEKVFTSLAKAGALDEFGYNRTTILNNYNEIKFYLDNKDMMLIDDQAFRLTEYPDDVEKNIGFEKSVLEMNLLYDPISLAKEQVAKNGEYRDISNLKEESKNVKNIQIVGQISSVKEFLDKNGQYMAYLFVKDGTAEVKATVFARNYDDVRKELVRGNIVKISGNYNVNKKYGNSISVSSVDAIDIFQKEQNERKDSKEQKEQKDENKSEASKKKEEAEIEK